MREAERAYLVEMLQQAGGNVVHAARNAGVHRSSFHRLMRRHGIRQAGRPVNRGNRAWQELRA